MKRLHIIVATALVAALGACSKGSDSPAENGMGADVTSGTEETEGTGTAGSYPAEMNGAPGEGTSGVGATGVAPDEVGNPPSPDTVGDGTATGAGGAGGTGP